MNSIQQRLQCSRATVMRVLDQLREISKDPIPFDRQGHGYRYLEPEKHRGDLPFLWFSTAELHALLVIQQQLEQLQPGLLGETLAPLRQRIEELLAHDGQQGDGIRWRILLSSTPHRRVPPIAFGRCAEAVLQRKRMRIEYHGRSNNDATVRDVSPQRLISYRDNWYLDAWCHLRDDLRRFAVERIRAASVLTDEANELSATELDRHLAAGFGIFSGPATAIAVLRFTPERARWVADEVWHPLQRGTFLPDGEFELRVPYGDPTELIMEILKYGPDVRVVAPSELRQAVIDRLRTAMSAYAVS